MKKMFIVVIFFLFLFTEYSHSDVIVREVVCVRYGSLPYYVTKTGTVVIAGVTYDNYINARSPGLGCDSYSGYFAYSPPTKCAINGVYYPNVAGLGESILIGADHVTMCPIDNYALVSLLVCSCLGLSFLKKNRHSFY